MRVKFKVQGQSKAGTWLCFGAALGGCLSLAATAVPALGQVAPAASQVTPKTLAPEQSHTNPAINLTPAPGAAPPGAANLHFVPSKIILSGGLDRMARVSDGLIAPLQGHYVTVKQLYQLAAAVEGAYAKAGYPFARVTVPPQTLKDNAPVTLIVVDGYIETIDLSHLPPRLRIPVGQLLQPLVNRAWLRYGDVERRVTLAGQVSGANLRTALARGDHPGGVKLIVEGDYTPVQGDISYDNRLGPAFKNREANLQLSLNSLLGLGDQVYVFASGDPSRIDRMFSSQALRKAVGGGISLPFGANGTKLNLETTTSVTQPLGGFFLTRDDFVRDAFRLSTPLIVHRDRSLTGTVSVELVRESEAAPQFGVDLSIDRYTLVRGELDYWMMLGADTLTASTQLTHAWGARPETAPLSRGDAQTHFGKLTLNADYKHPLPYGFRGDITFQGQAVLSGGLPTSELFALDGPTGLSTFTSGQLPAEQGASLRLSVSRPVTVVPDRLQVSPYVFAAGGKASFALKTAFDTTAAEAAGVGVEIDAQPPRMAMPLSLIIEYGAEDSNGPIVDRHRVTFALNSPF